MSQMQPSIWCPGINLSLPEAQGLVLALPFWEGSGARAGDYSGRNHHGPFVGLPSTAWVATDIGKAVDFTAVADQYISVPHSPDLAMAQQGTMTFAAWIYPDGDTATYQNLCLKGTGTPYTYQFYLADTTLALTFYSSDSGAVLSNVPVVTGQWNFVVVTLSGTTVRFYLDGRLVATKVGQIATPNTVAVEIGERSGLANVPFDGRMSNLTIWNRALGAGEIARLWAYPWLLYEQPDPLPLWVAATSGAAAGGVEGAIAEGAKAGEAWASLLTAQATAADGAKVGDAVSALLSGLAVILEGAKAGEAFAALAQLADQVSEGAKAGEAFDAAGTLQAALADGAKAGDVISAAATLLATLVEGAKAGDTFAATVVAAFIAAAWSEGSKAGKVFAAHLLAMASVAEGGKAGDAFSGLLRATIVLSAGAKAGDVFSVVLSVFISQRFTLVGTNDQRLSLVGTDDRRFSLIGTNDQRVSLVGS